MPGAKLKPLYMCKNLSDLQRQYDISHLKAKQIKPKMLLNTAEKLYETAEKEELNGDEEQSYVLFMKYLSVLSLIQKSDEFKLDKSMLNKKKYEKALNRANNLCSSLVQRYQLISHKDRLDEELQKQEQKEAEEEIRRQTEKTSIGASVLSNANGPILSASLADVSAVSLSSLQLYNLVTKQNMNVLILDARRASCYALSHMTLPKCINIPDDLIQAGVSAGSLANQLPRESAELFNQRGQVTLVVLLDWNATHKTLSPGSKLYILKNILLKWDTKIIYKIEPLILEGGYNDWVDHYPSITTDPVTKPPKSESVDNDFLNLDDIEYPTLNEVTPEMPSRPYATPSMPSIKSETSVSTSRPGVDRGLKAAAIKTYDEKMKEYADLLEANQQGADSSLVIETDRLEREKSWEETRKKREAEAEGEKRQLLQEMEDRLLKDIYRLEELHRLRELENKALRAMLQDYRKKEMDESNRLADKQKRDTDAAAHARIQEAEGKAKEIARQREEITNQRNKKLQEDRQRRIQEENRRERERLDKLKPDNVNGSVHYRPLQTEPQPGSSIMKRSHSSPNIAQMLDDEDLTAKHKAPQFDRTIKPLQKPKTTDLNSARQRNFNMVWGNKGSGLTGLKNLGNTCYMNSIIQCISNTESLTKYFCRGSYRDQINHHSKTRGEIAEEFALVIRHLWDQQSRIIACPDLKNAVGRYKEEFRGSQQQDSHEFLSFLINWLHDDFNNRTVHSKVDRTLPQFTESDKHWTEFQRCNESIILDLFYGQQKSTVECLRCKKTSSTYEPFNHISLPLPNTNSRCTFEECLKLYLNGDRITGWNCPSCKEARDAVKKFDICKLPPVLVIHFKRFYHDGWSRKKQTPVDFPVNEDLKMYSWHSNASVQVETRYKLYGVSNHYGTMEGGHYTAYCKNYVFSKWYKFDDHEVNEISDTDVKSSAAYILFYFSENNKLAVPYDR